MDLNGLSGVHPILAIFTLLQPLSGLLWLVFYHGHSMILLVESKHVQENHRHSPKILTPLFADRVAHRSRSESHLHGFFGLSPPTPLHPTPPIFPPSGSCMDTRHRNLRCRWVAEVQRNRQTWQSKNHCFKWSLPNNYCFTKGFTQPGQLSTNLLLWPLKANRGCRFGGLTREERERPKAKKAIESALKALFWVATTQIARIIRSSTALLRVLPGIEVRRSRGPMPTEHLPVT